MFFLQFFILHEVVFYNASRPTCPFQQKKHNVYILKCKRDRIPWLKWPVIITRYNWADVHGEIRYCSDRYRSGHQLWGSVCEPGTYNVIHRFQLADGEPAELQQVWSFLCLYMKGEPVPAEPKNKGRLGSWRPRKADKWPEEWERESTTARRWRAAIRFIPKSINRV